jgi:hypothetical protein
MSSYFDKASAEVGDASQRYWSGPNSLRFLNAAADIEDRVIAQVNLVTSDREFPDDSSGNGSEAIAKARLGQWERLRDNVAAALDRSLASFDEKRFIAATEEGWK